MYNAYIKRPSCSPLTTAATQQHHHGAGLGDLNYRGSMRLIATASLLVGALGAATPAAANRLSAVDPRPGVQLTLDGATPTATLTAAPESEAVRRELFGKRVRAVCARGFGGGPESVITELTWPASAT